MPNNQFMMVGLPASGKTSFLAAFWFMIDQQAAECEFAIGQLGGDRTYLNQIRDAWLHLKPVPRNLVDVEKLAPMSLKRRSSGAEVTLQFPDLSGEAFRQQWSKRQ